MCQQEGMPLLKQKENSVQRSCHAAVFFSGGLSQGCPGITWMIWYSDTR